MDTATVAPSRQTNAPDQAVLLRQVSWETYETLLADHIDRSVPLFAYDRGVLAIVSPSTPHESDTRTLTYSELQSR